MIRSQKQLRKLSDEAAAHVLSKGGHRRICSKTYAKGSGMIPRLDFAAER
jgi:hypothetical protein